MTDTCPDDMRYSTCRPTELWTHLGNSILKEPHTFRRRHAVGQYFIMNGKTLTVERDIIVEHVFAREAAEKERSNAVENTT